LVVLFVSVLSLFELARSNNTFLGYVQGVNARQELAAQLLVAAQRRAVAARNLVLTVADVDLNRERAVVLEAHRDVQTRLEDLKNALGRLPVTQSEKERQLLAEISRVEDLYGPVALNIVERAIAGQRDEAIVRINRDCIPLLRQLLAAGEAYMQHSRKTANDDV